MKTIRWIACAIWVVAAQAQAADGSGTATTRLTLEEAWLLAEQNSTMLKAARASVTAAEGPFVDARSLLWNNPEISGEVSRRRLSPADAGSPTVREWGAGISQAFEIAGQQGHRRDSARKELLAAQLLAEDARRELRAEVERRFVQVLAQQSQVQIERDSLSLVESTAGFADRRVAAGEDSRLEGNVARIEAGRVRSQLAVLQEQLRQSRLELAELLQWPPESLPEATGDLEAPNEAGTLEHLLAMAAGRERLKALQAKEDATRSRVALELAARYPDVTIGAGVAREGTEEFRERVAMLTVSVPLPLFRRNAGGVAQARAELTRAQSERQAGERDAQATVRALWHRQRNLVSRLKALRESVIPTLEENQRLSQKALREGEISLTQQVLVNRQLLDGRRDLLEALTDLRLTHVAMELAAGGAHDAKARP